MGRFNTLRDINKVASVLMPENVVLREIAVNQVTDRVQFQHSLKQKLDVSQQWSAVH